MFIRIAFDGMTGWELVCHQGLSCSELVHRVIEGARAFDRAAQYNCIAKHFPPTTLRKYFNAAPYHCHYMLWRLALLQDMQLLRLDELLQCAEVIPGWQRESPSLLNSRDFAEFWSLVWQLQVAEFLLTRGFRLEWPSAGPDLTATRDGEQLFVECVAPRKQYAKVVFLEELLSQIHPQLHIAKSPFLPLQVLDEGAFGNGLDAIVGWLTTPGRLEVLEAQAECSYPVLVPLPEGWDSIVVYFEGPDSTAYQPGILPQGGGRRDAYLQAMLEEIARGKQDMNALPDSHPNVVAVNLLLDDLQLGHLVGRLTAPPRVNSAIDELVWGVVGIDDRIHTGSMTCLGVAADVVSPWSP